MKEEPVIVFSYVAADVMTTESLTAMYVTLSQMGRVTNQGEVGLVIDGKYYGITEYASDSVEPTTTSALTEPRDEPRE